jgi:hypothetical protein
MKATQAPRQSIAINCVVFADLLEPVVLEQVNAAVSDIEHQSLVALKDGTGDGRSHALKFWVATHCIEQTVAGRRERLRNCTPVGQRRHDRPQEFNHKAAGHLTACMPADAVCHERPAAA